MFSLPGGGVELFPSPPFGGGAPFFTGLFCPLQKKNYLRGKVFLRPSNRVWGRQSELKFFWKCSFASPHRCLIQFSERELLEKRKGALVPHGERFCLSVNFFLGPTWKFPPRVAHLAWGLLIRLLSMDSNLTLGACEFLIDLHCGCQPVQASCPGRATSLLIDIHGRSPGMLTPPQNIRSVDASCTDALYFLSSAQAIIVCLSLNGHEFLDMWEELQHVPGVVFREKFKKGAPAGGSTQACPLRK